MIDGPLLLALLIAATAIIIIVAEAVIMFLFKLNSFTKSLADSLMVNIGSFLLGVLLFLIFNKNEFEGVSSVSELLIFYFITFVFEALLLKLLNDSILWQKLLPTSFVMNLVSFGALYFVIALDISV